MIPNFKHIFSYEINSNEVVLINLSNHLKENNELLKQYTSTLFPKLVAYYLMDNGNKKYL